MILENGTNTGSGTAEEQSSQATSVPRWNTASGLHGWWQINKSLQTESRVHCWALWPISSRVTTINLTIMCTVCDNSDSCGADILCHWQHATCRWRPTWHQSVSHLSLAVSKLLTHNASTYIEFPTDYATQRNNIDDFYKTAAFPNVLRCVDGT